MGHPSARRSVGRPRTSRRRTTAYDVAALILTPRGQTAWNQAPRGPRRALCRTLLTPARGNFGNATVLSCSMRLIPTHNGILGIPAPCMSAHSNPASAGPSGHDDQGTFPALRSTSAEVPKHRGTRVVAAFGRIAPGLPKRKRRQPRRRPMWSRTRGARHDRSFGVGRSNTVGKSRPPRYVNGLSDPSWLRLY
jgi:hypothetical protein